MLLQRVRQFVRQHALFGPNTRVMAALSGGSDSVALCALLHELDAAGEGRLAGVAHFNHQLRPDAARDEEFSAAVARSFNVSYLAGREDVASRARRERCSLEVAARRARYAFFEAARLECGADVVALGHTRDDQAETVLLRLLRGAGPKGLAAMYPRHGAIIRPLLDCRREELRAFLRARQLAYVEDETNTDVTIPRNRVRAELMPLLSERFNAGVVDALAHEAELAREMWAWLESEASRFELGSSNPDAALGAPLRELALDELRRAPVALRRLVVWRAMTAVAGGRPVSFKHVAAALELVNAEGRAFDGPGHRVQRLGSRLVLTGRPANTTGRWSSKLSPGAVLFEYPLSVPGVAQVVEAGCVVSAEVGVAAVDSEGGAVSGRGAVALVSRSRCQGRLAVRNRRPGDRFSPVGVGGQKKLQDYFVDRKVARADRAVVPLVVDETDQIVWVAGYGIDEAFRVTDASQSVLLLRLKLLGGCA